MISYSLCFIYGFMVGIIFMITLGVYKAVQDQKDGNE